MRATMEMGPRSPALRDRHGRCLWFLPAFSLASRSRARGTPASCTTPVVPGMVVKTQTERLQTIRRRRHGALHLRSSAELPDLLCQRGS